MIAIREKLFEYRDPKNAAFQAKLTPGIPPETFLGVRVPKLRLIEKQFRNTEESKGFLNTLPHEYYDENILHSVFISNLRDYDQVLDALEVFLPYVDNWAVCDTLRPIVFKKQKVNLLDKIKEWIASEKTYTCRFGIDMLMTFYLDDDFQEEYLALVTDVHSEEYYVKMMIAWFFATALAKQWDSTIPYIDNRMLDKWVHNKIIQKACESYRITDEQKTYLRTLKQ